jgi:hypothetical protein
MCHYYVHKFEVELRYGGPEEGGWWYDAGAPVEDWQPWHFLYEDAAYKFARKLNEEEHKRRDAEESYPYHSVLAWNSTHYAYNVASEPVATAYPESRPHYE